MRYVTKVDIFVAVPFDTDAEPGTDDFYDAETEAQVAAVKKAEAAGLGVEEYEAFDDAEAYRPAVGQIVQWYNDYTGEVIEHHPYDDHAFKVYWHKWSDEKDNATLTGWEYDMHNCKVVTKPVSGQWWPK